MLYWILEYGKVLAVYLFIMYLWPSVVLRKYLSGKGMAFRFSFCTTFMILLINTVVLMLGIVKLLNVWLIRALFYGPLLYIFGAWVYRNREKTIYLKYLLTDICSFRRFVSEIANSICSAIKNAWRKLMDTIRPHLPLYIMLAVAVVYGVIYFSYGAFHERYYGTTDVYVHHSWIDMLLEGNVFGAGVYPEGMHCFVYAMNVLFGVEVYSCLLFLGGIHIIAFLLSVYLFFREIFPWKYSGLLVLVLYLILRLDSAAHVGSMARLQWTIPQEFAHFTVFLCGAYLLRFLRGASSGVFRWKNLEFLRDENLLIFLLALAVSIAVHFYVTIMAFFLCLAIGVFFLVWVFAKKKALPLVLAIVCGVVIAVTPMLAALASGIEFQDSIGWAMSVISESQQELETKEEGTTTTPTSGIHWEVDVTEPVTPEEEIPVEEEPELTWIEKFYENSFVVLYREDRAVLLFVSLLVGAAIGLLCHLVVRIRRKAAVGEDPFCGYLFLVTGALIFMVLFAAPRIGLLEIIQINRLCTMTHILAIAALMIPVDLVMTLIDKRGSRIVMDFCATALCLAMCVCVVITGNYHSYLNYVVTRYSAAAEVTSQIIQQMEPESFTIVSAVDELYQIKSYGYHEESVRFIQEMKGEHYTLPTEYVFIFIEKQPLEYAHDCLTSGPSWLANEEYLEVLGEAACQSPNVHHTEISEEAANKSVIIPQTYSSYKSSYYRTIIFSRMNQWVERFQELYPYQLTTVYEDDAFVCYMFRQNQARLLELAILN